MTYKFDTAYRPTIQGTRHMVAAGHYMAAQAGFLVLQAGGNAIDAGVAAGITLNIVEPQMCSFTGVAPIMIYLAAEDRLVTIDGLGTWPRRATCELLAQRGGDCVPEGILQTVVPGAPDAWLTALERYGTMRFSDVAAEAIRLARDGFPAYRMMALTIKRKIADFPLGTDAGAIFLPRGRAPEAGEMFVQADLARTLQYLVDEEKAKGGAGRAAGIAAVRHAIYQGDLAKTFADHQRANGGLLDERDLAGYRVTIDAPLSVRYRDIDLFACGPWCQGPMLLQVVRMAEALGLDTRTHNAPDYIHGLIEILKLVAADREAYYGDPKFVPVPIDTLLSADYARARIAAIGKERAFDGMPPAGRIDDGHARAPLAPPKAVELAGADRPLDTSYACAVDAAGNAFSATPSDGVMRKSPIVPGTGMALSPRGIQSRVDPRHPACVAPGKRPRLTPNPAIAMRRGEFVMPFGTPGGDLQVQAMAQVFLNLFAHGMDPQAAVEATRFYSYSYPDSFAPHAYYPGLLKLEDGFPAATAEALARRGHRIEPWPSDEWPRTGVCIAIDDRKRGLKLGAADSRRTGAAVGW
ncbi:MAG: gamma-glutamyltransferase family protein [Alphaproteobacteria bacterium]|nr:gamma-glutamyltransferase family protein [Alphaproteobacteria bacterium]